MRRRDFIALIGGAGAAWPLVASAQQADRTRRIGVLMGYPETESEGQAFVAAFRDGLQQLGWFLDGNCGSTLAGPLPATRTLCIVSPTSSSPRSLT
jgi:hypothetical protein